MKELIEKVRSFITKHPTKFRTLKPAEENLAITLQFLGTGEIYESFTSKFRIHKITICHESSKAIYKVLQPDYMKLRCFPQEWKDIPDG